MIIIPSYEGLNCTDIYAIYGIKYTGEVTIIFKTNSRDNSNKWVGVDAQKYHSSKVLSDIYHISFSWMLLL